MFARHSWDISDVRFVVLDRSFVHQLAYFIRDIFAVGNQNQQRERGQTKHAREGKIQEQQRQRGEGKREQSRQNEIAHYGIQRKKQPGENQGDEVAEHQQRAQRGG